MYMTLFFSVDMEQASSCTKLLPIEITLYDIANLYAAPPMTVSSDRDECIVKFKAPDGGYFKIYVQDLVFGECNVNVKIYEDMYLNTAKVRFRDDKTLMWNFEKCRLKTSRFSLLLSLKTPNDVWSVA